MVDFPSIITGDSNLDRVQANVRNTFNSIPPIPQPISGVFIGGNILSGISVGTTPTSINHGLNRVPQVWVICDQNTLTNLERISWDSNSITLQAGSACVVSLYVN